MKNIVLVGINSKFIHTSLSVRCLESYAKSRGESCEIAEFTVNSEPHKTTAVLHAKKADIYAFSVYIFNVSYVKKVASDLKKANPSCLIIFGGPEVSFCAEEFIGKNRYVDIIISGEGEKVFYEIIHNYDKSKTLNENKESFILRKIGGISLNFDEHFVTFPQNPPACSLDEYPFPYTDLNGLENRILYYESSRGCPFRCSYCISAIDKQIRTLSLPRVFEDLMKFIDKKVKQVKFVDRTFNFDKKRARKIWEFIIENDNFVTNFHFEIAAWLLDEETISFLNAARSGLFQFEVGIQSTNIDTIKAISRPNEFEKLSFAVKKIDLKKIAVHVDLIAGLPYESYEIFKNSFNDVYKLDTKNFYLGFLKLLSGAPIANQTQHGYVFSAYPPYEVIKNKYISYEELGKLKKIEELLDIYYNSGLCSFLSPQFLSDYFGKTPFDFYEKFVEISDENGFFDTPKSVQDKLFNLLIYYNTLTTKQDAEQLAAFDLFRQDRIGAFPHWLSIRPSKELRSIIEDVEKLSEFIDEATKNLILSEDKKYWARNCEAVFLSIPSFFSGEKAIFFFLYGRERKFFAIPNEAVGWTNSEGLRVKGEKLMVKD